MRISQSPRYLCVFCALIFVSQIQATPCKKSCNTDSTLPQVWKSGYLSAGGSQLDLESFNATLAAQGIGKFDDETPTLGFGWQTAYRRMISGGDVNWHLWRDRLNGNLQTSLSAATLLWTSGINVMKPETNVILAPYIGVGLGVFKLRFTKDELDFSSVLKAVDTNRTLWQTTFLLTGGLGLDYRIASARVPDKAIVVGLRAGYQFDPRERDEWRSRGVRIDNGPAPSLSGPYVRVNVGFGERPRKFSSSCKMRACAKKQGSCCSSPQQD